MPESPAKHLILNPELFFNKKDYGYAGGTSRKKPVPAQERTSHSQTLSTQIATLKQDMAAAIKMQKESQVSMDFGLSVEFESFDGIGEVFETASFAKKVNC